MSKKEYLIYIVTDRCRTCEDCNGGGEFVAAFALREEAQAFIDAERGSGKYTIESQLIGMPLLQPGIK